MPFLGVASIGKMFFTATDFKKWIGKAQFHGNFPSVSTTALGKVAGITDVLVVDSKPPHTGYDYKRTKLRVRTSSR